MKKRRGKVIKRFYTAQHGVIQKVYKKGIRVMPETVYKVAKLAGWVK